MRLIDADALREILLDEAKDTWNMDTHTSWANAFEEVASYVGEMPTIAPAPRWIPVTERLPESLDAVNIVWVNTDPEPYYESIKNKPFVGTGYYCNGRWWWYSATCEDFLCEYGQSWADVVDNGIKVTHWMPLPEPPEVAEP